MCLSVMQYTWTDESVKVVIHNPYFLPDDEVLEKELFLKERLQKYVQRQKLQNAATEEYHRARGEALPRRPRRRSLHSPPPCELPRCCSCDSLCTCCRDKQERKAKEKRRFNAKSKGEPKESDIKKTANEDEEIIGMGYEARSSRHMCRDLEPHESDASTESRSVSPPPRCRSFRRPLTNDGSPSPPPVPRRHTPPPPPLPPASAAPRPVVVVVEEVVREVVEHVDHGRQELPLRRGNYRDVRRRAEVRQHLRRERAHPVLYQVRPTRRNA